MLFSHDEYKLHVFRILVRANNSNDEERFTDILVEVSVELLMNYNKSNVTACHGSSNDIY